MSVGRLRTSIGPNEAHKLVAAGSAVTFAMASLNTGWAVRFTAPDARDILSVNVNFATVTAAGTIQCRIETIDATTGKPTGSLYDANATKDFTPVAGWQTVTFASPPTAGLTPGTEYAVVLLTTVGGTTMTIRSYAGAVSSPTAVLTAADGTTRSNFADVSGPPIITFIMEDSVEETIECLPFAVPANYNLFGTQAGGLKFIVPTGVTWNVLALEIGAMIKVGTPAGDLRARIFTSADAVVSGSTRTVDKDSLSLLGSARRCVIGFGAPVALTGGTYRVVLDSSGSANSSNCWRLLAAVGRAAAVVPSGWIATSTADVTAGTITWGDTNTDMPAINLRLDDIPNVSAVGGLLKVGGMHAGMQRS